jgi:hypothetical protein
MKKLLIVLALTLSATALGIACGGAQTPKPDTTIQETGGSGYGGSEYGGSGYGGATYGAPVDDAEEIDDGGEDGGW